IPSDGVTEAQNKDGQEYGIHRFIKDFVEILEEQNMWKLNLTFIKEHYYNDKLRQYAIWDERYSLTGNGIEDDMGLLLIRVK
ncbi:MAG TPA: hypothetical protein VKS21_10065, partial [Spirochaetota bacterium]|nr:hypothetical protein [Spirochaetota bacterium]